MALSSGAARRQLSAVALVLTAIAFAVYWPSLRGGFLWDDDLLITDNRLVKAADGLYWIWFSTLPVDYWPMTNTSFWLEWRLWGMNPIGYHVTNVLLHTGNAMLFWAILRRLSIPGAFLAALVFVVHPVNVESVAWIAQRKNTLSTCFFLLSILWYVRFDEDRMRPTGAARWYWLSVVAFVLAMLSKGSVVPLPLLLLLLVWWKRNWITRADVVRVAPFFVVAVGLTAVNLWFRTKGATEVIRDATLLERVLGAGGVVWFYLYKALVPIHLVFVYPQWRVSAAQFLWWLPLVAAVVATGLLLWMRAHATGRALLFAWVFFCVSLVPVAGLADVYFMKYSLVADHYQYNAILGPIALVSAAVSVAVQRITGRPAPSRGSPGRRKSLA